MQYEIVATLGPSSAEATIWKSMLSAGVTAFRLNTSHLTISQLGIWLDKINDFIPEINTRPPLVLDLQGSKWRLGQFTPFDLADGQSVELVYAEQTDRRDVLPVPHPDFFAAASYSNGEIVLSDARICLVIKSLGMNSLITRVTRGGKISPKKGVTFITSGYRKESLSEKDQEILKQTNHLDFVRYAVSYVRDAAEMARYRTLLGPAAYLIAKLERKPALEEVTQIAASSNELWLCRGDLGAELGIRAMAEAVHWFSAQMGDLSLPVLMAGQVLEHMSDQPTPTRSEVCYLYDTLSKGYRGFVLSDETAIGRYPLESCRTAAMFES